MSKQFKRGLVVGKFSPPHWGHVLMIEEACRLCDELDVFIYSNPELPAYRSWSRAKAMEMTVNRGSMMNDPFGAKLRVWSFSERDNTPTNDAPPKAHHEFIKRQYDYYCNFNTGAKKWEPPDVVIGSEDYMPEFARALGCAYVQLERVGGINATAIRSNPRKYAEHMPERVLAYYRKAYQEKVVFLGAESTGKSTTAIQCADELNGVYAEEFGSRLYQRWGGKLVLDLQWDAIVEGQVQLEDKLHDLFPEKDYMFCDTEAMTTKFFMYWMRGHSTKKVDEYAEKSKKRYKHWFLCDDGIPFDGSNMRGPEEVRKVHQGMLKMMLNEAGIEYITLRGSTEDRVAKVNAVLQERRRRDWKEL